MGAWGRGVFENDTACDFAAEIARGNDLSALEQALDRVLASEDSYLDATDAEEGLAAADIVARLAGKPGLKTAYTASVDAWVDRLRTEPPAALIQKARASIARVLSEPSELLELWQEVDDLAAWRREVEAVLDRL